jgi:hypothetical protein
MNERIDKLFEQALEEFTAENKYATIIVPNPLKEKFAQLIVEECGKLCEHKSNDDEYDQYDMGQSVKAENIKTAIKQHFGVEE